MGANTRSLCGCRRSRSGACRLAKVAVVIRQFSDSPAVRSVGIVPRCYGKVTQRSLAAPGDDLVGAGWGHVLASLDAPLASGCGPALLAAVIYLIGGTTITAGLLASLERPYAGARPETMPPADAVVMLGGMAIPSTNDVFGFHFEQAGGSRHHGGRAGTPGQGPSPGAWGRALAEHP